MKMSVQKIINLIFCLCLTNIFSQTKPIANDQSLTVNERESVTIKLTGSDEDGDYIQYRVKSLPEHGKLTTVSCSSPTLSKWSIRSSYDNGYDGSGYYNNVHRPMVDDNNGKHRTVVFLHETDFFDFIFEGDENNTLGGSDGNLESGGDYINVSQGGNYLITLDTRNNTYTIELVEDAWGVVGSATYSGWNGIDLKLVPDNCNDGTYVIFGVKLEPGQEIKFRQNDSWGNNYGDDNTDGTLEPNGANIPVPTYTSYNIVLNISDNTYEISENAADGSNNSYDISLTSDLIGDVVTESALINAEVIYEGTSNYALSDSFTFYTNDGNEDSDLATVSISINPSNSNPVANDLQYSVQKNSSDNEIILIANDVDNYWFDFSANIISQPSNGRVELTASENL